MRTFIQRHLPSFIIGILTSIVATLLFEYFWGYPSGLFRKPISFYLINRQGSPVLGGVRTYLTVFTPMVNTNGLISLDLDNFPKNHRTLLHIESSGGETPLIDPIELQLHDLQKPIRIVITPKKKVLAQVIDWNEKCIGDCSFFATTREDRDRYIKPMQQDGGWFVFYIPKNSDFTFSVTCPDSSARMECEGSDDPFQTLSPSSPNCQILN